MWISSTEELYKIKRELLPYDNMRDHVAFHIAFNVCPLCHRVILQNCHELCDDGVNTHFGTQFAEEVRNTCIPLFLIVVTYLSGYLGIKLYNTYFWFVIRVFLSIRSYWAFGWFRFLHVFRQVKKTMFRLILNLFCYFLHKIRLESKCFNLPFQQTFFMALNLVDGL